MADAAVQPRYARVRIPYGLDEDLEGVALVIADPTMLPGLTDEEPPVDQELIYVGRYRYHTKLRCAFGHKHQRGYVFHDESGRHYLIGNTCGRTQLGMQAWDEFVERIEALEERARDQATLRRLREDFARHRDWIAGLAGHPCVVALSSVRGSIWSRELTPLAQALATAYAKHEGQVFHLVDVRDFAAEERERERLAQQAERDGTAAATLARPTIMKKERRVLGTLQGRIVTASGPDPKAAIETIPQLVDAFLAADAVRPVGASLRTVIANARAIAARIALLRDQVMDARVFFDPANLNLLRSWVANQPTLRMAVVAGARAVRIDVDGKSVTISAPPPFTPDDEAHFDDLAATVGGGTTHGRG